MIEKVVDSNPGLHTQTHTQGKERKRQRNRLKMRPSYMRTCGKWKKVGNRNRV